MHINLRFNTVPFLVMNGLVLFVNLAIAQPYYYFPKYVDDKWNAVIYRVDLQNGTVDPFVTDTLQVFRLELDPTGMWLYVYGNYGPATIFNCISPSEHEVIPKGSSDVGWVYGVLYAPLVNRFFVSWTPELGSGVLKATIYDASTFQFVDSLLSPRIFSVAEDFFSQDGSEIYFVGAEGTTNHSYIECFSTSTNSVVDSVNLFSIGQPTDIKSVEAGQKGRLLIGYNYPSSAIIDNQYIVYSMADGQSSNEIRFPWRSQGYLSPDGKYVILEEVDWDTTRIGGEYRPGIVYVFDASTGELMQRLTLPPGGKILTFDNYPQIFYYYNDSTDQSLPVNVAIVTPTNVLIDTLVSLKHQAVANGWLNDRPSYRRDCDDAMKDKDWFRKGNFNRYSRWRPDESWDFDRDWNNGIVGVLDKRLDKANDALGKGDSVKARRDLEIFVMEIEMLNSLGKKQEARSQRQVLTAEGYAPLKYNAEYLIDRLPERHGREQEENPEDKR